MQTTSHIVNLGSGVVGMAAVSAVPEAPTTGNTSADMVLKIVIAVVSVLPSILSLFKKKKEA